VLRACASVCCVLAHVCAYLVHAMCVSHVRVSLYLSAWMSHVCVFVSYTNVTHAHGKSLFEYMDV